MIKVTQRNKLLSYFSWIIGGWNASPGVHAGHLVSYCENYSDDEAVVRHLLAAHENQVTKNLRDEVIRLKVEVYDLQRRLGQVPIKP